jgi:hypothetical protein
MFKKIEMIFVVCAMLMLCTEALAWSAVAFSTATGALRTEYNYDTPEEAVQAALDACNKDGDDCKQLIVRGGEKVFTVSNPIPVVAARAALTNCKKLGHDCRVVTAVWDSGHTYLAVAEGDDAWNWSFGSDTEAMAIEFAVNGCKKYSKKPETCKVKQTSSGKNFVLSNHSWFAIAESSTYTGLGSMPSKKGAIENAMQSCNEGKKPGETCKVSKTFENPGPAPEPASMKQVLTMIKKPAPVKTQKVTTRQVNRTSCTNNCVNGSCVRTFPDGRTERWQAQRVYDAMSSDWKWDTNSCGG